MTGTAGWRLTGSRIHTRGALAFQHAISTQALRAIPRPDHPTRVREYDETGCVPQPPVPLMRLVVPAPTRYLQVNVPPPPANTSATLPIQTTTVPSTAVNVTSLSHGEETRCMCALYTDIRDIIISCMRCSQSDGLAVLITKAEKFRKRKVTISRAVGLQSFSVEALMPDVIEHKCVKLNEIFEYQETDNEVVCRMSKSRSWRRLEHRKALG